MTNAGTGAERKVNANQEGYYTVPLLLPGEYRLAVEHLGFKPIQRTGVVLEVDQRAEVNFTLEIGGALRAHRGAGRRGAVEYQRKAARAK